MKRKENVAVWEDGKDGVSQELTENREKRALTVMGWREWSEWGGEMVQGRGERKVGRSRLVGLCRVPHVHPEAILNGVFITDHPAFAHVETTIPSISGLHLPRCHTSCQTNRSDA